MMELEVYDGAQNQTLIYGEEDVAPAPQIAKLEGPGIVGNGGGGAEPLQFANFWMILVAWTAHKFANIIDIDR